MVPIKTWAPSLFFSQILYYYSRHYMNLSHLLFPHQEYLMRILILQKHNYHLASGEYRNQDYMPIFLLLQTNQHKLVRFYDEHVK